MLSAASRSCKSWGLPYASDAMEAVDVVTSVVTLARFYAAPGRLASWPRSTYRNLCATRPRCSYSPRCCENSANTLYATRGVGQTLTVRSGWPTVTRVRGGMGICDWPRIPRTYRDAHRRHRRARCCANAEVCASGRTHPLAHRCPCRSVGRSGNPSTCWSSAGSRCSAVSGILGLSFVAAVPPVPDGLLSLVRGLPTVSRRAEGPPLRVL